MNISALAITRGANWAIGGYAVSVFLRFGTNIILARLLAPEFFGIMVIITSMRVGIELVSDIGVVQNIVHNKNGDSPAFYNTAWTLQVIRGLALAAAFFVAAKPISDFYGIPVEAMQISAVILIFSSLTSTSLPLAERRLQYASRNIFEAAVDCVSSAIQIVLAILSPTIWSLVYGGVIATMIRAGASYLMPESRQAFTLVPQYAREILHFGKWILLASIVNFAAMNFDRLYLGAVAPLAVLGVFGMARSIAELPAMMAIRLNYNLTFPIISSAQTLPRAALRAHLSDLRWKFLLAAVLCLSAGAAIADIFIEVVYDERYHDAAWMLPILLLGVWGSVLSSINEATLLGYGKPVYGAVANGLKLFYLVAGLPLAFQALGVAGAVLVVATSDFCRYVPIVIGQMRERFAFRAQDALATLALAALFCLWTVIRWSVGAGTSFDTFPLVVAN